MKSKKSLYFLLFMLENSKMLPLPALSYVDCNVQSTLQSTLRKNAGRGRIFEFSSIRSKKEKLVFLAFYA